MPALADTIPGYENVTGWASDGVMLLTNTDNGRSAQFTVGLNKPLTDTWGWSLNYTYTNATEVNPLTSSRAISNWSNKAIFDPNSDEAATSNYEIKDRVIGSLQFRKSFFGDYATTISTFYEGRSGAPHSWRFANDMNGDGYTNDLLYIPGGPGEVMFTGGAAMESAFFEWVAANGLNGYQGAVVERNGLRNSWVNQFDLRISQELPGFFRGHKSEIWLDVMNVGNLINKDWGRINTTRRMATVSRSVSGRRSHHRQVHLQLQHQSGWQLQPERCHCRGMDRLGVALVAAGGLPLQVLTRYRFSLHKGGRVFPAAFLWETAGVHSLGLR